MPKEPKPRACKTGKSSSTGKKKALKTSSANVLKQNKAAMQEERRRLEKEDPSSLVDRASVDIELVATAFEGPPNKHSVYALSLYFTQKCVEEGLGKSTADGIHGAFANYWDHLPDSGRKYAGDYLFNAETGKVSGNPARALEIPSFLKSDSSVVAPAM
ncbi:hypothetical protein B0H14DRAFT_3440760 [Mycena olivaceomarginata]|nr:hypothetical protein B0H14DRAFT_3440760 [Mycena olivaceomarginata]